jgi:hypothetical protein
MRVNTFGKDLKGPHIRGEYFENKVLKGLIKQGIGGVMVRL